LPNESKALILGEDVIGAYCHFHQPIGPQSRNMDLEGIRARVRGLSWTVKIGRWKRYAVLGAGFAGLSVAWHLLQVFSLSTILPSLHSYFFKRILKFIFAGKSEGFGTADRHIR
jgi:hypothetical protein